MKIEKICLQCGKSFITKTSEVGKFCSKTCDAKWRSDHMPKKPFYLVYGKDHPNYKEKVRNTCKQCGKSFEVRPSLANQLHCSSECYGKSQDKRVEKACAQCGKPVMVKLRYKRKNPERSFCSRECYGRAMSGTNNPAWRGGYEPYYGDDWNEQRRAARKRDNYTCQNCGMSEDENGQELDVHHIIPRRKFKGDNKAANKLSNLISFCMSCHRKLEPRGS